MGKLIFIMVYTRPNIYFVILKLSQYISDPGVHYNLAVKHVIHYLHNIINFQLRYRPTTHG